jgi:hypothetical protein
LYLTGKVYKERIKSAKDIAMKIRTERIECYWAKGNGNARDYHFYVDLVRKENGASKEDEAARKEFIKVIKGHESTEGRGYNWRVTVQTLRTALEFLPDPKAIKAEMERFDKDGVLPPAEPYHVSYLSVYDTDIPTIIHLTFDHNGPVPEKFRRACDHWKTAHRLNKDEYQHVDLFGGRSMSVTQEMLIAFESWLSFDKPWRELYTEAFDKRKTDEQEQRARQYESDAPFRAKHPDWDKWTNRAQDEERYKAHKEHFEWQERMQERIRDAFRQNEQFHRAFSFSSGPKVREAFELFELPDSATLQEVKKRYRSLSKVHHPDVGGSEEAFKKINSANMILMQHLDH